MLDLLTSPQFLKRKERLVMGTGRPRGNFKESWWTDAELAILKDMYPDKPMKEVLAALPGRSWNAIKVKATKEKIARTMDARKAGYGERWTTKKLDLLRKLYPNSTKKTILKAFPGHSWNSIQGAASRHNIERSYKIMRLTKEQRNIILKLNELGKAETMRLLPDFDWRTIATRAYGMGVEINILPAKDLEIAWSMYLQGYSREDIQTMVNTSPQTWGRALKFLKKKHNYQD